MPTDQAPPRFVRLPADPPEYVNPDHVSSVREVGGDGNPVVTLVALVNGHIVDVHAPAEAVIGALYEARGGKPAPRTLTAADAANDLRDALDAYDRASRYEGDNPAADRLAEAVRAWRAAL
jgi:hypothetical protein